MNNEFISLINTSATRLQGYIERTPLNYASHLSRETNSDVYQKMESTQVTGSCKSRSVFNKLLTMSEHAKESELVTVSTGNNGISTSFALQKLGMSGIVFLPHTVTQYKIEKISSQGMQIRFSGQDLEEAEIAARAYAEQHNAIFFSPYNNWDVIYGQGTIGLEIIEQLELSGKQPDIVLVPIGGGGLISGIGGYLKAINTRIRIIGVQPLNSAVLYHSIRAGEIIQMESLPTLSDATAGGVEQGSITFGLCKQYVDDYILVSEKEIHHAMCLMHNQSGVMLEGAGALSVAALLQQREKIAGKTVIALCCGSNIEPKKFKHIVAGTDETELTL
ncbi:MAG: pyridoxal-phosphate dependent enzyme [Pseudomonadota bacterium]